MISRRWDLCRTGAIVAWGAAIACSSSSTPTTTTHPPPPPTGATVYFDFDADLASTDHFYDFPWPSDLRLTTTGAPDLRGIKNPLPSTVFAGLLQIAQERSGFPVVPVAWFRFTSDLAPRDPTHVIPGDKASPILLVDVDPHGSAQGELIPTIAQTMPQDAYLPTGILGVSVVPGFVLLPAHQYAFVVLDEAKDSEGKLLGVAPKLASALAGGAGPVAKLYASLPPALRKAGVDVTKVVAATVFTTGDVVNDLYDLSTKVFAKYAPLKVESVTVDAHVLDTNARFCELQATITYPQFQPGSPPYDTEGLFELDASGLPKEQGVLTVPVTITLPKSAMPSGGYPLVVYFHGTGGMSTAIADRGIWRPEKTTANCPIDQPLDTWNGVTGCNTPGQGPGWVLAPAGFAMAASALPLNPQRWPAGATRSLPEWININNVAATRDIFRQGVLEERMFFDALRRLTIPASAVSTCTGLSLPKGETAYHFRDDPLLAQGQSMGAMYNNILSAIEPRIKALVPTGSGGYWSFFILQTQTIPNIKGDIGLLLGLHGDYSHLHPTMHVAELGLEWIDPIAYMPRQGKNPLPGQPVRPSYEPHGLGDSYFPTDVQDACALAYGNKEAGQGIWSSMQTTLTLGGLGGIVGYPVTSDVQSLSGMPRTGVVVEYKGDGVYDPHAIYTQLDSVKYQYGCFFETFLKYGKATVPAPQDFSVPCAH